MTAKEYHTAMKECVTGMLSSVMELTKIMKIDTKEYILYNFIIVQSSKIGKIKWLGVTS